MSHSGSKEMEIICDFYDNIVDSIEDVNNKLKAGDGKIRSADSEYIKNLSKALYNVNVTVAMLEHENDEQYSPEYSMGMGMRSRQDGNGGGTSRRERDRRGRFSGNDEAMDMADNIRRRMRDMPEDMRRSAEDFVSRLENGSMMR
jgi:hypothetical protein